MLEYVAAHGPDRQAIASLLGVSYSTLNNQIDRQIRDRYHDAAESYYARVRAQQEVAPVAAEGGRRSFTDVLNVPVRPFAVECPAVAPSTRPKKWTTAVCYGDTHYPFHDPAAVQVVLSVIKDVVPDVIVNMGDVVDCWQISRFDKDPARLDTLQDNIDAARTHLHQVAQVAPKARRVLLEGNHENRLSRTICQLDGAQRELARLRVFQQAMTWPNLLQTAAMGWEFVSGRDQSRTPILPKIITKHGEVVRKWSGWSGKGEMEKYGRSGISGHTHRLGTFLHRDHNGNAQWTETGCTCLLDAPYGSDFDWQQGCVVLTWNDDHRLMNTEFVAIREGAAIWRDRGYVPRKAA